MSVNLMSAIFETEFFDIQDEQGNVTKASTAKLLLLAMADHANDEGEGAYPSIERLSRKTALSDQTIRNTFDALRYNGIIFFAGKSKYGTNNHTINTKAFPKAIGKEPTVLTLYPFDPQTGSLPPQTGTVSPTYPFDPNHTETIQETPKNDFEEASKKIDSILAMANFPGAKREARIASIQSYLGETFHRNTETKEWLKFARFIDDRQQNYGEDVKVFVRWLFGQKGYDPQFWPVPKMMEFWPSAFVRKDDSDMLESL